MPAVHEVLGMMVQQQLGRHRLERRPEHASRVTDNLGHVAAYDQVMCTKLVAAYAGAASVIHRVAPEGLPAPASAVDLGCGPGHFTLCLARHLGYGAVTGVDLSGPMVRLAAENARAAGLDAGVRFVEGDMRGVSELEPDGFDLACCMDAMHHLDDLDDVRRVFLELDRLADPQGLVVAMDLVRLRTPKLTQRYVEVLGADYRERGLTSFYEDFRDSMYAAWTAEELRQAIPRDTRRWWCHLVPRGLPTVQIVLGLPVGRRKVFLRRGYPLHAHPLTTQWYPRWQEQVSPEWAKETRLDCRIVELGLATAQRTYMPPRQT